MSRGRGEVVSVVANPPATIESIKRWKSYFKRDMPQELEAFYSRIDGITVRVASESSGPNDYPDAFLLRTLDRMVEESASRIWSFFEYAGKLTKPNACGSTWSARLSYVMLRISRTMPSFV